MPYLLDADWAINALAGKRGADRVIAEMSNQGIAIAITTVGEIHEGAFGAHAALFPDHGS
jgi:LDH2 family malate/lactate/ureidoglycolate dehydrogenase